MLQGEVVALYQHLVKKLTDLESSGIIFLGRAEVSCNAVLHVDCPALSQSSGSQQYLFDAGEDTKIFQS